jgi:cyanophycinase
VTALEGGLVTVFALDEPERWEAGLRAAGAAEVRTVVLSAERPPAPGDLDGAAGVYVAGGLTPAYQEVLCADASWLRDNVVYAGFSAGAAIAGRRAVVGGWQVDGRAVLDSDLAEDLDPVTVRDGLGVVDVLVDVHAAQWGTLSRLAHAVLAEGGEGWAIDEGTALECAGGRPVAVHGVGAAARVLVAGDGEVVVRWFVAGPTSTAAG